jgi:hypothetical protein
MGPLGNISINHTQLYGVLKPVEPTSSIMGACESAAPPPNDDRKLQHGSVIVATGR